MEAKIKFLNFLFEILNLGEKLKLDISKIASSKGTVIVEY